MFNKFDIKNKSRAQKIVFFMCITLVVVYIGYIIAKIDIKDKTLLESSKIEEMKKDIINSTETQYLKVSNIEGNNNYILLTFKDERVSGQENTYYTLYDVKNKKSITEITGNNNEINILDATIVKYIKDDIFLIITSSGECYIYNPKKKEQLIFCDDTEIIKEKIYKYIYKDNKLYVLTRNNRTKYNEKALNNYKLFEIDTTSINKNSISIEEHPIDENDFVYSFVINDKGQIGICGSSSINISEEYINDNSTQRDKIYLSGKASVDNNTRLINTDTIWVKYIDTGNTVDIQRDILNIESSYLFRQISKDMNVETGNVKNIPLYLTDNDSLFIKTSYDNKLYDIYPIELSELLNINLKNNTIEETENTISSDIIIFKNYKDKFTCFFKSNDGYYGIDTNSEIKKISDSNLIFINDDKMLAEENGDIIIKKYK